MKTLLALVLISVTFTTELAAAEEYRYFKEVIDLTVDPTTVAIQSPDSPRGFISAAGISGGGLNRIGMMDWWLFSFPDASASVRVELHSDEVLDLLVKADRDSRYWFSPVYHGQRAGFVVPTQTLLLKLSPGASLASTLGMTESKARQDSVEQIGPTKSILKLRGDWQDGREVLTNANRLADHDSVLFAEPDMLFSGNSSVTPSDPLFGDSWGLLNTGQFGGTPGFDVQATTAWDYTLGSGSVITVVIDSGVDQGHPDINQIPGADFTDGPGFFGGPGNDCDNHGTAVAGVVSGRIDNGIGTVGIAPQSVIASARVLVSTSCSGDWNSFASWTVNALAWADSIGARVSNNSNGYIFQSSSIADAYQEARDNGMVHFASAGNDSASPPTYPASLSTVNAVGAIESSGELASFSSTGSELFVVGPGLDVYTTDRLGTFGYSADDYTLVWGTSFASPFAAGLAALMLSLDPGLTPDLIGEYLSESALDLGASGYDTAYGHGLARGRDAISIFYLFGDGFEGGTTSAWN